ncbi:MAG: hypothetical protein ACPKQO_02650 [Nitrososphaeraceae archaeon]
MKIVLISGTIFLFGIIFLVSNVFAVENKDFILSIENVASNPEITNIEILDPSDQVCKGECEYLPKDIRFYGPKPSEYHILTIIDLRISDSAHNDFTPKKKDLYEQWSITINCSSYDIIEDNDKERYYCDGLISMYNNILEDGPAYKIKGLYSIPEQSLLIEGNFTDL